MSTKLVSTGYKLTFTKPIPAIVLNVILIILFGSTFVLYLFDDPINLFILGCYFISTICWIFVLALGLEFKQTYKEIKK